MDQPLRLILIGKNDIEKSKTGNTILNGKTYFLPSLQGYQLCYATVHEREVSVINTPALSDISDIGKCICMSSPGPHALILVVPFGEFEDNYVDDVENVISILSEELFKFIIVVFTRSDFDIGEIGKCITTENIDLYVSSMTDKVKKFLKNKCHGKVVGFDNSLDSYQSQQQVSNLFSFMTFMKDGKPQFFKNATHEIAETSVHEDATTELNSYINEELEQSTHDDVVRYDFIEGPGIKVTKSEPYHPKAPQKSMDKTSTPYVIPVPTQHKQWIRNWTRSETLSIISIALQIIQMFFRR
ncbi:unnamed protein product [Mytilus coruscus]|uniref:AIG1-type G domain-containing protein n=1 Tax=Mytilus coruscus TaxID=42192 RepID=A0A6J8A2K7_MYTCO|nr:unnamed protein product [Mytilus coruscus]